MTEPADLMRGAVDMHCHFGPDAHLERSVDCVEAAEQARAEGMAAIVLKSHDFPTAALAYAVEKQVPGIRVFGGLCFDLPIGGLNPFAMEVHCRVGGKVVWLPTISSENDFRKRNVPAGGFSILEPADVFGRKTRLKREVLEILALAKEYEVVVETGHVSLPEIFALLDAAHDIGLDKILVTHAMEPMAGPQLSIPQMQEVAARGGLLEQCAMTCGGYLAHETPTAIAEAIRRVGAEHCVLSTDYGQKRNIAPAPGLRNFFGQLLENGISAREIEIMARENPGRLLGLG
jgi:hypothetical protein